MRELEGSERTQRLLAGLEQERSIEADPNLKAGRFVKMWNALEAEHKSRQGSGHRQDRERVEDQIRGMTRALKMNFSMESAIVRLQQELKIERDSRLARVLQERDLKRALSLSTQDRGHDLGWSL
jgi:hypothetical protein